MELDFSGIAMCLCSIYKVTLVNIVVMDVLWRVIVIVSISVELALADIDAAAKSF